MWGIVGKTDGSPMGFEDLHNQFQAQTMFRPPTAVLRAGNIIPLIQDFQKFRSDPRPVILNRTQTAAIFFADHRKRCAVGGKNSIMVPVMKKM